MVTALKDFDKAIWVSKRKCIVRRWRRLVRLEQKHQYLYKVKKIIIGGDSPFEYMKQFIVPLSWPVELFREWIMWKSIDFVSGTILTFSSLKMSSVLFCHFKKCCECGIEWYFCESFSIEPTCFWENWIVLNAMDLSSTDIWVPLFVYTWILLF